MKKIIAIAVVAFALAGCDTLKTGTERAAIVPMTIGEPKIVLSQTGLLVVDQEPLLLRGRNSVTWTLPADNAKYQDFAVTIDAATKRIVREGKVVTFRPLDGPKINQPRSGSYPVAGSPCAGFGGPMTGAIRSLM
jgi:hypothetical protein